MRSRAVRNTSAAVAACLLLSFAGGARAAVVMEFQSKGPRDEAFNKGKAYVEADRLRVETSDHVLIFRADKPLVWMVDTKANTYMELTKEQMGALADQMKGAMAAMEKQLASMPPEQRAMVEKMMSSHAHAMPAGKDAAPLTWTKNGASSTVNTFACAGYDGMQAGTKAQEACVADYKQFAVTKDDLKVFGELSKFMESAMGSVRQAAGMFGVKTGDAATPDALPGVPVRHVVLGPDGEHTSEITKVARQDVAASQYDLPSGLTKQEMAGPRMGPGGPPRR